MAIAHNCSDSTWDDRRVVRQLVTYNKNSMQWGSPGCALDRGVVLSGRTVISYIGTPVRIMISQNIFSHSHIVINIMSFTQRRLNVLNLGLLGLVCATFYLPVIF